MPFCSSCGTENPENAKFCAKCGASMAAAPAVAPPAPRPAAPQPVQPVQAAAPPTAPPAVQPARAAPPVPTPAKQALSSPPVKAQVGSKKEPIPGAPNQTQLFMAAAGVSTGAKFKKLIIFIVVALIVGTGLFFLVRFAMHQQEQKAQATKSEKKVKTAPATVPVPAAAPAAPAPAPSEAAGVTAPEKNAEAGKVDEKKSAVDSAAK